MNHRGCGLYDYRLFTPEGTEVFRIQVGNGPWHRDNLDLPEGPYRLVPKALGYVSIPMDFVSFYVPEPGIVWRYSRLDFEFVRPEDAIERFGLPICGVSDPIIAASEPIRAPPSPLDVQPAPDGICIKLASNYPVIASELRGSIAGPQGLQATIRVVELSKVEGECYYPSPGGIPGSAACLFQSEPQPVDELPEAASDGLQVEIPVGTGFWGYKDLELGGRRLLIALHARGYRSDPAGYTVAVLGGKAPSQVLGLDFNLVREPTN